MSLISSPSWFRGTKSRWNLESRFKLRSLEALQLDIIQENIAFMACQSQPPGARRHWAIIANKRHLKVDLNVSVFDAVCKQDLVVHLDSCCLHLTFVVKLNLLKLETESY
jgi:hypothetical protein